MTTKKRDYSNFEQFPGKYNKGTNRHEFPILWQVDQSGKLRQWQIFVRLIKESKELPSVSFVFFDKRFSLKVSNNDVDEGDDICIFYPFYEMTCYCTNFLYNNWYDY